MRWGSEITLFILRIIGCSLSIIVFRITKGRQLNVPNLYLAYSPYTIFAVSYFAAAQIRVVSLGIQIKHHYSFVFKTLKEKESSSPLHYFCKENKLQPVKVNQSQNNIKTAKKGKSKHFSRIIFVIYGEMTKRNLTMKINIKIY